METAISLPFTIDAYGKVTTTTDQSKIWSDRVKAVIGTNLRERLMNPDFGTLVPSAFMENADTASSLISTEVERAFTTQLDLLTFTSVDVTFDEYTGTTHVSILYDLPNNEQVNTTVALVAIDGKSPAYQENL